MSARVGKQLQITTPNKVGMLEAVTSAIADAGVNIEALCAYGMGSKAIFLIVTNDNARATKALKSKRFKVKEEGVVIVDLDNSVGAAGAMGEKLKNAKVNLSYIYGTTCGCGGPAMLVFKSDKNKKASEVLG